MRLVDAIKISLRESLQESGNDYKTWKRKNVTLRGIKELGKFNEVYGSFGKGLYTAPLGNKAMAKGYGEVYYVVNAIPKNPKIVDSLNSAEILRQQLVNDFCKKNNISYSPRFFEENTSMEHEMLDIGYDGLIIKGREMVNYTPEDIRYYQTEKELIQYYETIVAGPLSEDMETQELYHGSKSELIKFLF